MQNKNKFFFLLLFVVICLLPAKISLAADNFNPNYIIGNLEILDYTALNLEQIKNFLARKDGYLNSYSTLNPDGKIMTAAEIIYDRAVTNKVNPKFLIVLLQKEMSYRV